MNYNNCQAFLDFFDELVKNFLSPEDIPQEVKDFYDFLSSQEESYIKKPILTESGLQILEYMQSNNKNLKAKDIADGIGTSSRKVSGAIRKLVSDGFVDKINLSSPVLYTLTEQGCNFNIEEYKKTVNDG